MRDLTKTQVYGILFNSNGIDSDLKYPTSCSEHYLPHERPVEIADFSGEFGQSSPRFLNWPFFVCKLCFNIVQRRIAVLRCQPSSNWQSSRLVSGSVPVQIRGLAPQQQKKIGRGRGETDRSHRVRCTHHSDHGNSFLNDKRWGKVLGLPIIAACNSLYQHQKKVTMLFFGLGLPKTYSPSTWCITVIDTAISKVGVI